MDPDPPGDVLHTVTTRLAAAGCVAASDEAALMLDAASDEGTLEGWLHRREQGEPLAWILGQVTFCGRPIQVARGVYVPRAQSDELARRAASLLPDGGVAVDLCTGAGAIAAHMAAEVPSALVIGVDIDEAAVRCARSNGVKAVLADIDAPLRSHRADVVTAVAPYVPTHALRLLPADVQRYEPRLALDGGDNGLALVRRVIVAAHRLLVPGGWLLLEVGTGQDRALAAGLGAAGFSAAAGWHDDDGDLRGLAAQASS